MLLAVCEHALGRDAELLEHLRRALDLAARYDYEYWLQRAVAQFPQVFSAPEAAELLPTDLREQLPAKAAEARAAATAERPAFVVVQQGAAADLTVKMLGAVEIFRDPARPLAADAWVTRRSRDILCFIASRRHRRVSKDTIIDTFWGESDFGSVEKNFHPTISHIRKGLNSNQPLKQNFLLYRDGDYQLNPEFSYRIDTEEFDRLVSQADAARRARSLRQGLRAGGRALPRRVHAGLLRRVGRGAALVLPGAVLAHLRDIGSDCAEGRRLDARAHALAADSARRPLPRRRALPPHARPRRPGEPRRRPRTVRDAA
jgi:hypothetical protein